MKKLFSKVMVLATVSLLSMSAFSASTSWSVDKDGSWSIGTNWDSGTPPGSTSSTTNTDTATFGNAITHARAVTVDANRNIQSITFANTANSTSYSLVNGTLLLSSAGTIRNTDVINNNNSIILSDIVLQGDNGTYTFAANSTNAGELYIGGRVTGVSSVGHTTTLSLQGINTGLNYVTGTIGNGSGGGSLAITKDQAGTWILVGANTYTGATSIIVTQISFVRQADA